MKPATLVLLALCAAAAAAPASALGCPDVAVLQNFNATHFLGHWYEIRVSQLGHYTFESGCNCVVATYTPHSGGEVGVNNTCNLHSPTGKYQDIVGVAKNTDPSEPAKLGVSFFNSPFAPYWIIAGDDNLKEYAVAYTCQSVLGIPAKVLWLLSRTPTLPDDRINEILDDAQKLTGIDTSKLFHTVQGGDCVYPF